MCDDVSYCHAHTRSTVNFSHSNQKHHDMMFCGILVAPQCLQGHVSSIASNYRDSSRHNSAVVQAHRRSVLLRRDYLIT